MFTTLCAPAGAAETSADRYALDQPASTVRLLEPDQMNARLRRLQDACELLADGFDGLDEQIAAYVASTPTPPGDVRSADTDRFLDWLEHSIDLDDEQRDFVTALRGHHAVEYVAVKQRLAHARFQELLSRTAARLHELETNSRLTIHLNPIHVWSQFETRALLDDDAEIPATVLFIPCGTEVRTVVVEPQARELLCDLESAGPMRVTDLLRRTSRDQRESCLTVVRQLATVGVIALG